MLKDRRALLERELKVKMDTASTLYFTIIRSRVTQEQLDEYTALCTELANLRIELAQVTKLIAEGHD